MRFEKIWVEQCRATRSIKRRFGARSALDYLVGEKLRMFEDAARHDAAFARELNRPILNQALRPGRDNFRDNDGDNRLRVNRCPSYT